MGKRIHILGGSGVGSSTLARNLANRLDSQAFDTDDFYWLPTDPPFEQARPQEERLALMEALFLPRPDWILAGPFIGWGGPILDRVTHVIFLSARAEVRLDRLARRERRRHGDLVAPGGMLEPHYTAFLDWAACYDDPSFAGRSRAQQETWLARLKVPVIRLDGAMSPPELTRAAMDALDLAGAGD